jgi:hypothetical protein
VTQPDPESPKASSQPEAKRTGCCLGDLVVLFATILGRVPREAAGPFSGQVESRVPPLPRPERGS